jgi:hypothetical protein
MLRVPKVGFLPDDPAASRGERPLVPWYERLRDIFLKDKTPASRAYRYMARLIEREFGGQGAGVCIAFSSPDSDKKTSDALLMLAYCLQSELDGKVLIVDARLKDQADGITGRLGLLESLGFAEVMREGFAGNENLIQSTNVPNVDVLPAGAPRGRMAMPVHRDKLGQLLGAAKARYGYVLVQVGSVLRDTRNLVTAAGTDAIFVFVAENRTFMKTLDDCRKLLLANGVSDVRVVITGGEP